MKIKRILNPVAVSVVAASFLLAACSRKDDLATVTAMPKLNDSKTTEQAQPAAHAYSLPQPDSSVPLAKYVKIESGVQMMYMYYGLSKMPPDMNELAENISSQYRATSDQFKRQDMLKVLGPRIQASISENSQNRYVVWEVEDSVLEHYDFNGKRFPVKEIYWNGNNQFWWNDLSSYRIGFSAPASLHYLNVSDESAAREIEGMIGKYQSLRLRLYAFVQDTDLDSKKLKAVITHVELLDRSGRLLHAQ